MSASNPIKISVILPVYNVEEYIGRCIESLQTQTLKGLEFIFVDDCSTDDSMAAVDAWAAEDGRVLVIHNEENLGAGPSRNRGIEAARGDYLSFVDPDDYVSPDFYELLYATAIADGGHDIAKGSRIRTGVQIDDSHPADGIINRGIRNNCLKKKAREPLYKWFRYEHQSAIYKRTLFQDGDVMYGTSKTAQDTTFLLRVCYKTGDLVLEERAIYYYVQRETSAVHSDYLRRTLGEADALNEKVGFLLEKGLDKHASQFIAYGVDAFCQRYQYALGKGLVQRADTPGVLSKLAAIVFKLPLNWDDYSDNYRLAEVLSGCPLITQGLRSAGEDEIRISVILPVFNPGPGICKCIESLRMQLLDGLEFIFVDDCSTDGSMAAAEAWAAEDERVRILQNEENIGAGPSRNRGIEAARGDYLSFIDPDDYISPDFYELLYKTALDTNCVIVKGVRVRTDVQSQSVKAELDMNERIAADLKRGRPLYLNFNYGHQTAIYSKVLFGDPVVRYGSSRNGEDVTFLLIVCSKTSDIAFENRARYYYVYGRNGAATAKYTAERSLRELDALEQRIDYLLTMDDSEYWYEYLIAPFCVYPSRMYLARKNEELNPDKETIFLKRIREQLFRVPVYQQLLDTLPELHALVEHGAIIPSQRHGSGATALDRLKGWVDFLETQKTLAEHYKHACSSAVIDCMLDYRREEKGGFEYVKLHLERLNANWRTRIILGTPRFLAGEILERMRNKFETRL